MTGEREFAEWMLRESRVNLAMGYFLVVFAVALLVWGVWLQDLCVCFGASAALFFGVLALKKEYDARRHLREMKKVEEA